MVNIVNILDNERVFHFGTGGGAMALDSMGANYFFRLCRIYDGEPRVA